ncbi:hypothetical protein COY26_05385 [Candidatus Woesearchaeota archaeon CG_4_10_14_0_2_um_filter_33_10]|nr:MAG: hypothetical protein AUJ83_02800 [Candidatus Woesearchaeota archaeon CG1_02_33_12]PIN77544.1 MAG: hypothetical protein COV14_05670 [Candidatus Woesearchaeota archaeon CG10_big_fil_rev_8_21_14_0_10_33_12]PIU72218.1 MAG: hypothetical protein COS79_04085 [Candidatus Woesearchaeota archaeon CG06_land_8_20_14_3_00_33_13]PIZ51897.1 MAG: hypothetical protein COY26_05385 [Candidatus Woesearchaeota archaeon CG_4_10_14_0_2_um_filter_33_10]
MVKPEIISEKPITLTELKQEIDKIKKRDKELNFRVGKTEEYLGHFVTLSKENEEELIKKLEKLNVPRLKDIHITKIVDILPKTVDELKIILQGYTITVNNENLKKIVDALKDFAEKKK